MHKIILICVLLAIVSTAHVRKTHKAVHDKKQRTFNSAFIEFQNFGEADYHLDSKVAQHWAQVTSDVELKTTKHNTFVEVESDYKAGVVGETVDLSKNAGVTSYTVTGFDGNVIETASNDLLADQLNSAYFELTKQIQDNSEQTK